MNNWIDVDIGDEVTMPVGVMVEKRTHNGKTQFRNPVILSVCSPEYIDLVQSIGCSKPRDSKCLT